MGWSDAGIHDAIQVIAYFNYINRVADAVGIQGEPEWASEEGAHGGTRGSPVPNRVADAVGIQGEPDLADEPRR